MQAKTGLNTLCDGNKKITRKNIKKKRSWDLYKVERRNTSPNIFMPEPLSLPL